MGPSKVRGGGGRSGLERHLHGRLVVQGPAQGPGRVVQGGGGQGPLGTRPGSSRWSRRSQVLGVPSSTVNEELRSIFIADQEERKGGLFDPSVVDRDRARRQRVQELLDVGEVQTANDYFHAAMVFQHGGTLDAYRLAGELAGRAVELGHEGATRWHSAKWLVAAARDRWLMRQGRPQEYGTQYFRQGPGGPLELWEVDPATTDEERATYNVPPLAEALARAEGRVCRAGPRPGLDEVP